MHHHWKHLNRFQVKLITGVFDRQLSSVTRQKCRSPLFLARQASTISNVLDTAEKSYVPGSKHHGFTVQRSQRVPELALHALFLEHDATGAEYLHLARNDHNNVFGVAFRTPPKDSTGVAHILEHTVLCGSQKYPIRDPFFNMLTRSLSTFMNALTSSDWTMYPFSTLNPKDYYNLMGVYLDAAFFPRLRNIDLRQEGIRLEPADMASKDSPIVFKGVVFNEMKGVFSNQENIYARKIQNFLLPSGPYHHESGGDPLEITKLTWEQLRSFHASYYHPSNARFYSYGDMPLEKHLETVSNTVMSNFSRNQANSSVNPEPRWNAPRREQVVGPVNPLAPPDQQATTSVSFLLPEILDPFENFCMSVVAKLLIHGPKAPFYQSLLQSGLGADYSPGSGLDNSIREGIFSIGLKNMRDEDVDKVIETIHSTIDRVVSNGFDPERIDAILHEIELGLKHQTTSFGLHTLFGLISSWNHGADPVEHLKISEVVERFRKSLKEDPKFLQKKLQQYFQDNKHQLVLVMKASADYEAKMKEAEEKLLGERTREIDEIRRQKLVQEAKELQEEQDRKPDVSVLPTLRISDIEKSLPRAQIERLKLEGVPVLAVTAPTNGVTYFRGVISTETLDPSLIPFVPLFCEIATQMGAGDMDYRQLSQKIELKTGGLSVGDHVEQHHSSEREFEHGIALGSVCLDRNVGEMFGLWKEIFNRIKLEDMEQFQVLVKQGAASLAASLADNGHGYAMTYSSSFIRPAGHLREQWNGLHQVHLMKAIASSENLSVFLEKMRAIAQHVLSNGRMRVSLNATEATMKGALSELNGFLSSVSFDKNEQQLIKDLHFKPAPQKTHLTFPFAVHYASRSFPIPFFTHEDFAACRILSRLIGAKFLHREIREKGGAYGGGARVSPDGIFQFFSYRDPKAVETFEAFEKSIDWASKGSFSDQDIDEAKLSVFSDVDKPVAPGQLGKRELLHHIDDDMYQKYRERLIDVSREHLVESTKKYLAESKVHVSTVLGPVDTKLPGWERVDGSDESDVKQWL